MFITAEDFNIRPFRLTNIDADENFAPFVNEQEQDRLKKILGSLLYDAFMDGLYSDVDNLTPRDENVIEQRWRDLRDGVVYQYNDKSYHWEGMTKAFRPYIFSMWKRHNPDEVIPDSENATNIGTGQNIEKGWNAFADLIGNQREQKNTLYGYLYNSADTFLDVVEDEFDTITAYMLEMFGDPGRMNFINF